MAFLGPFRAEAQGGRNGHLAQGLASSVPVGRKSGLLQTSPLADARGSQAMNAN